VKYVALAVLAACGGRSGPSHHGTLTVMAGSFPEPDANVVSHTVDGQLIDSTSSDAVGVADIGYEEGALISVLYPGTITDATPAISVLTAPFTDGMTVVGPPDDTSVGTVVGGLQMKPKNITADGYDIQLGCATFHVTQMPAVLDVGARCMGSDQNLDVLITATNAGVEVGHAAGRVMMLDGMAEFDPPSWDTSYTMIPVTAADGATVTWSLITDGLPFTTPAGSVPAGLMFSSIVADADIASGARHTTRYFSTPPASIDFADSDFLPAITSSLAAGYTWTPASLGDAVDLRLDWDATPSGSANVVPTVPQHFIWDAVMPPDTAMVAFPPVGFTPTTPNAVLRYVDSSAIDGFPSMEVHSETTVPPVTDGQIRITQAAGLQ
jgi:hypothetical protein